MEIALVKNAQASRHKPHEVEEATGTLTITRKCFRHLALDYVLQVSLDPTLEGFTRELGKATKEGRLMDQDGSADLPGLGAVYLVVYRS